MVSGLCLIFFGGVFGQFDPESRMGLLLTHSVLFALELSEVQLVEGDDHRQPRYAAV